MSEIQDLIVSFAGQLTLLVQSQAVAQTRSAILASLGGDVPIARRGPGRPRKETTAIAAPKKSRRKGPVQLCPSPGCKNAAAPIFGQLCAKHKDAPKRLVKKWREARRAKKLKNN